MPAPAKAEVLTTGKMHVSTTYHTFGESMVAMRTTATVTLVYLHDDHPSTCSWQVEALLRSPPCPPHPPCPP